MKSVVYRACPLASNSSKYAFPWVLNLTANKKDLTPRHNGSPATSRIRAPSGIPKTLRDVAAWVHSDDEDENQPLTRRPQGGCERFPTIKLPMLRQLHSPAVKRHLNGLGRYRCLPPGHLHS